MATGSMHLAWLLKVVSTKPEAHARESDAEEAADGEGQDQDLLDARIPFAEEKKQARHDSCSTGGEVVLLVQSDQCRGCSLVGIDARRRAYRAHRSLPCIRFHISV